MHTFFEKMFTPDGQEPVYDCFDSDVQPKTETHRSHKRKNCLLIFRNRLELKILEKTSKVFE